MADVLVNGIRLHYEVFGNGSPLVLAHGHGATLDAWKPQVAALAARHQLILYDSRGHGRTEAPLDPGAYTLEAYVEDQRRLMDHLGIAAAGVGGTSMGGMIALQFAITYPTRVRALLLFDTCASNRHFPRTGSNAAWARRLRRRWRKGASTAFDLFHLIVRAAPVAPAPLRGLVPTALRDYLEGLRQQTPAGRRGAWRAILTRPDLEDRLPEIRAPTLVVVGERDPLAAGARHLANCVPNAQFVLMRGVGHGVARRKAAACNRLLDEFLAAVDEGRPIAGETVL